MFSVGNILSLGVFSFWGEFLYFAQTSIRPWTFCEGSRFTMPFPMFQVVFGSWMTTFLSNRAIRVLSSPDVSLIITSEPLWVPWPHFTANNWRLSTFEVANLLLFQVCCMLTCWNTTDISFYYDGHHLQAALAAMILLKEILGWGDFIGIIFIMAALLCNELWGKGSPKPQVCRLTTTQGSSQARRDEMQDLMAPKIPWSECPKTSKDLICVRNRWGMFLKSFRLQWNKRTMQAPMSVRWQCKGAAWGCWPWGCHRANQCELSRQDTHSYLASWMDFQWKFAAPGTRGARKPMRRKAAETIEQGLIWEKSCKW